MTSTTDARALMRRLRPIRYLKFRWATRHWDRNHFPGCPIRYGTGSDCIDPDLCAFAAAELRPARTRSQ